MKIILVATDAKGKNVVFVSDTLRAYPLEEAVRLAKDGKFEGVYAVEGKNGAYLRTHQRVPKTDQLETLAVSSRKLFVSAHDARTALSTPPLARYLHLYEHTLQKDGGPFIVIEGKVKITKAKARIKLQLHKEIIFDAAKKFSVDPYLLGAIIIDEIAQLKPLEPITDPLFGYVLSANASAGIAQVTMDTARGLIRDGYYNPDPTDQKLVPKNLGKVSRRHLYTYVKQSQHSIFFGAAKMRETIAEWKKFIDLTERPEIIATLYSISKKPHAHPQPSERGLQIVGEFYQLAQEWLR